ncbi:MAG: hypothetical protein Q4P33_07660 [Flaviflexus sp.]|nr:hypothetical protein [Flaviflexus sp.]
MDNRYNGSDEGRGSWYGSGGDGAGGPEDTPRYDDYRSSGNYPGGYNDYGYDRRGYGPGGYGDYPSSGAPEGDPRDSLGQWVVSLIITLIPVVGLIYLIFLAISKNTSPAKQNWARAMLIVSAFILAFLLIFGDPTGTLIVE